MRWGRFQKRCAPSSRQDTPFASCGKCFQPFTIHSFILRNRNHRGDVRPRCGRNHLNQRRLHKHPNRGDGEGVPNARGVAGGAGGAGGRHRADRRPQQERGEALVAPAAAPRCETHTPSAAGQAALASSHARPLPAGRPRPLRRGARPQDEVLRGVPPVCLSPRRRAQGEAGPDVLHGCVVLSRPQGRVRKGNIVFVRLPRPTRSFCVCGNRWGAVREGDGVRPRSRRGAGSAPPAGRHPQIFGRLWRGRRAKGVSPACFHPARGVRWPGRLDIRRKVSGNVITGPLPCAAAPAGVWQGRNFVFDRRGTQSGQVRWRHGNSRFSVRTLQQRFCQAPGCLASAALAPSPTQDASRFCVGRCVGCDAPWEELDGSVSGVGVK